MSRNKNFLDWTLFTDRSGGGDLQDNSIRKTLQYDIYQDKTEFKAVALTDMEPMSEEGSNAIAGRGTTEGSYTMQGFTDAELATMKNVRWQFKARILGHDSPHNFIPNPCDTTYVNNAEDMERAMSYIQMHTTFITPSDFDMNGGRELVKQGDIVWVELTKNVSSYDLQLGLYISKIKREHIGNLENPTTVSGRGATWECYNLQSIFNDKDVDPNSIPPGDREPMGYDEEVDLTGGRPLPEPDPPSPTPSPTPSPAPAPTPPPAPSPDPAPSPPSLPGSGIPRPAPCTVIPAVEYEKFHRMATDFGINFYGLMALKLKETGRGNRGWQSQMRLEAHKFKEFAPSTQWREVSEAPSGGVPSTPANASYVPYADAVLRRKCRLRRTKRRASGTDRWQGWNDPRYNDRYTSGRKAGQYVYATGVDYCPGHGDRRAFDRAIAINPQMAVKSTSWGIFQVMGFHFHHAQPPDGTLIRNASDLYGTPQGARDFYAQFQRDPMPISEYLLALWFNASPQHLRRLNESCAEAQALIDGGTNIVTTYSSNRIFYDFSRAYNGSGCCNKRMHMNYDYRLAQNFAQIYPDCRPAHLAAGDPPPGPSSPS